MNILFGFKFEDEGLRKKIRAALESCGIVIDSLEFRNLKSSVEQYVYDNKDTLNVLILNEWLESTNQYVAEDYGRLLDMCDNLTIIPIIKGEHKGTEYVKALYNMGIYNALYDNCDVQEIGNLITNMRGRVACRLYYGLSNNVSVEEENSGNIARLISYTEMSYAQRGEEGLVNSVAYARQRLDDTSFVTYLDRLGNDKKSILRDRGLYDSYIGKAPEEKKRGIGFSPIVFGGKTETEYIEIGNEVYGVISLHKGAGATFVALNLAKEISERAGIVPAYVHMPDGGETYREWALDRYFGVNFVNHLGEIKEDGKFSTMADVTSRVAFIVENTNCAAVDDWSFQDGFMTLYHAPNPTILDVGCDSWFWEDKNVNLLKDCKHIIVVIDERDELNDIIAMRGRLGSFPESCEIDYVFNRCNHEWAKELEKYLSGAHDIIEIDTVRGYDKTKNLFVCTTNNKCGIEKLVELTPYEKQGKVDKGGLLSKLLHKEKVVGIGQTELAFVGMNKGAGTTYTAVLFASAFARRYKVAILDQSGTNHFECLRDMVGKSKMVGEVEKFTWQGMDFYTGCTYKQFAGSAKSNYDFVIVDYGTDLDEDLFLRANIRVVVMSAVEWRMREIDEYIDAVLAPMDKAGATVLAVPLKTNKDLISLRKLVGNDVCSIPYCESPFKASDEIVQLVERISSVSLLK